MYAHAVASKLKWLLVMAAAAYGALLAALCLCERALLYHPNPTRIAPAAAGLPQAEEVLLETDDGEKLVAWHVIPQHDKPIVLYFHGNGEIISWQAPRFRSLVSDGTGLLAPSYRGYGGSTGPNGPLQDSSLRRHSLRLPISRPEYFLLCRSGC